MTIAGKEARLGIVQYWENARLVGWACIVKHIINVYEGVKENVLLF